MAGLLRRKSDVPAKLPAEPRASIAPTAPAQATPRVATAPGDPGSVRLSFRIPRELHTRLKMEAVRQGRTIIGTVEHWIGAHTPAT